MIDGGFMMVVSINVIIDLNKLLSKENVKVHLRDTCGKQSLWLEKIAIDEISPKAYDIIKDYFKKENFKLVFCDDRINFWVE